MKKKYTITLAKTAGFCFGVDRAVSTLYNMVESGKKVCTLGPIIHNPSVIEDLEKKGVHIIEHPAQAPQDTTVVIRTHGVEKFVIDELRKRSLDYIDLTCPFVMKIQKIVERHSKKDRLLLIAGDENHPEVRGFRSRWEGESLVYKNEEELTRLLENHPEIEKGEVYVVAQTTFSVKEWEKTSKNLKKLCTNGFFFDTICSATNDRQKEAFELSLRSDAMIVVGGRSSSNTAKLKAVCEKNCPTFLVETARELAKFDFSRFRSVGVTAGASTPAGIIKEVLSTMSEILNEQTNPEEMSFEAALEENLKSMSSDQKVRGVVVGIAPNEIQVDIGRKYAGFVPIEEYSNDPTADPKSELKIGDEIDLIIMKTNDSEGTMMLSKRRFDAIAAWDNIMKAKEDEEILEGVVAEAVKGGVLVYSQGVRVFIPGSLTGLPREADLSELVKTKVRFRIIDVDKAKKRAVGSIRSVVREERKAATEAFWAQVEEGQEYTGTVKSLTSYGAFVDLGGVDGMVHISELSWKRIKHPSEVVKEGDVVKVYVKALDRENRKISLGYKRVEDNPWEILKRDYPVGSVVKAKVVGLTTFGAFANVIDGIDGLIHISQIADRHIASPKEVLSIGDEVDVKITDIDFEKKRVSLSIRALLEPQDEADEADAAEEAEAEEEAPVEDAE
ncbi:MAG: bifunctional 4-hydroxy-3-methylbut-2-enyl diphosphate reductase/30S ribosomal protein S1 [Oscillospiraceae bacterium]|nr:bifunctional 4-hydroxy-3-methylbut-2-enyl diphosphate reductase/30S ribosomal protein S1 [Oscillospiraceae bacterium]MDD7292007.1 bifunctional 4-hydroxy-3-methylbut-2-enyl diphosphate reductase/30S ribosomal protein S1 [Clostridiaceae bacterium]MDY5991129.1 bifunctional 4-hydroxy-3-methylbut-2-enyl diphosphate reductase/30S ribosomal protein S1 [Oscillospiraceae bacterium]